MFLVGSTPPSYRKPQQGKYISGHVEFRRSHFMTYKWDWARREQVLKIILLWSWEQSSELYLSTNNRVCVYRILSGENSVNHDRTHHHYGWLHNLSRLWLLNPGLLVATSTILGVRVCVCYLPLPRVRLYDACSDEIRASLSHVPKGTVVLIAWVTISVQFELRTISPHVCSHSISFHLAWKSTGFCAEVRGLSELIVYLDALGVDPWCARRGTQRVSLACPLHYVK